MFPFFPRMCVCVSREVCVCARELGCTPSSSFFTWLAPTSITLLYANIKRNEKSLTCLWIFVSHGDTGARVSCICENLLIILGNGAEIGAKLIHNNIWYTHPWQPIEGMNQKEATATTKLQKKKVSISSFANNKFDAIFCLFCVCLNRELSYRKWKTNIGKKNISYP